MNQNASRAYAEEDGTGMKLKETACPLMGNPGADICGCSLFAELLNIRRAAAFFQPEFSFW